MVPRSRRLPLGALRAKRRKREALSTNHAVVSIGTNSTRLLIAREAESGKLEPIVHRSLGTRLGANLKERGKLDPDGAARTLAVIEEYATEIRRQDAGAGAIATSAMRRATDAAAFAAEVERLVGAPLEIISGRREAELSFLGATTNAQLRDGIVGVLDVGGGSAEYAYGKDHVEDVVSCEIGAVRLSEAIPALLGSSVPGDPDALEQQARAYARERLEPLRRFVRPREVLAVGGTMFNAASIAADRDRDNIDGVVLTRAALTDLARRFLRMDTATRRAQPRISAQRADILPAGILIVDEALGLLDAGSCTISQADLLFGYLVEKYQRGD